MVPIRLVGGSLDTSHLNQEVGYNSKLRESLQSCCTNCGGPSGTRTLDLHIMSMLLWPTELKALVCYREWFLHPIIAASLPYLYSYCDKFAYMLFLSISRHQDSRHTRWVAGCILPLGADNGTRTRNTTLEESDVTVTLYPHIKCSWLPDFNLQLIA